jgi:hypothetical protein
MANEQENPNQFSPKAVEAAQEVLSDLKAKAKVAHDAEDVFMMSIMTDLISVASPIVTKAVARLNREERSRINAAHKKLRASKREVPSEGRPRLRREDGSTSGI